MNTIRQTDISGCINVIKSYQKYVCVWQNYVVYLQNSDHENYTKTFRYFGGCVKKFIIAFLSLHKSIYTILNRLIFSLVYFHIGRPIAIELFVILLPETVLLTNGRCSNNREKTKRNIAVDVRHSDWNRMEISLAL